MRSLPRLIDAPRLLDDRRGTAAVEFAIVAGVLVALLLGVGDLVPGLLVKFKAANAANAAADLTTQSQQLQASDVADIYAGTAAVLAPFGSTSLVLRVTSVASDGKGNAFVHWSCGQGVLPAYTAKSAVTTTPSGDSVDTMINRNSVTYNGKTYNTANTSYIVVESRYSYTTPMQYVIRGPLSMTNIAYSLPRQSSYVGFPWDGNVNDYTTAPASALLIGSVTLSNNAVCSYAY